MEHYMKCGCVVLAILFISLNVAAQPLTSTVESNESISNSNLPPLLFPKENVTIGTGLPPVIFPTENVTIGDAPIPVKNGTATTIQPKADIPPLIFPKTNGSVPLIELPPLIFPDADKSPINKTALEILNAVGNTMHEDMHILPNDDDDYYKEDSSESYDHSDDVEDVQAADKTPQKDSLEENYKSQMNLLPVNDIDDDTEVDHPIVLKNSHILAIVGAMLAVLCVCLYIGNLVWRRIIFNRYGMRERLVNEEDFYSNKSIHQNF